MVAASEAARGVVAGLVDSAAAMRAVAALAVTGR
jgi:hypothetical protein